MSSSEVHSLLEAFSRSGLTVQQLWLAAVGLGSSLSVDDVVDALWTHSAGNPPRDLYLTVALNEALADRGDPGRLPLPTSEGPGTSSDPDAGEQ